MVLGWAGGAVSRPDPGWMPRPRTHAVVVAAEMRRAERVVRGTHGGEPRRGVGTPGVGVGVVPLRHGVVRRLDLRLQVVWQWVGV